MMMMKKVQITNFKYKSRWSERDWKSKAKSSEQKKLKQKSKYWFKGEKGPFMCLRWILPSRKKNILKIIKQQKNTKQKENTEKISTLVDPSWLYCASIWISFSPSLIPLLLMLFFSVFLCWCVCVNVGLVARKSISCAVNKCNLN